MSEGTLTIIPPKLSKYEKKLKQSFIQSRGKSSRLRKGRKCLSSIHVKPESSSQTTSDFLSSEIPMKSGLSRNVQFKKKSQTITPI